MDRMNKIFLFKQTLVKIFRNTFWFTLNINSYLKWSKDCQLLYKIQWEFTI